MATSVGVPAPSTQAPALGFADICRQAYSSAAHSMSDPLVQQQAFEGANLRALAAWVAYPLDVLKTQVQAGHPGYKNLRAAPRLVMDYRLRIFNGYPGVGANSFLMGALMFGGYRFFDNFWRLNGVGDYWRPAVAGASIGALCGLAATPLEQVKTVMALQESWLREGKIKERVFNSVGHGVMTGSYRLKFYAFMPLMCRTALFDCQLFFYNSRLREWLATEGQDLSPNMKIFIGTFGFMVAGLVGATVNYPFDLVKGRMMAEAYPAVSGQGSDAWFTDRVPLLQKLKRPILVAFFAFCLWRGWVGRWGFVFGAMSGSYFDMLGVPLRAVPGSPLFGRPFAVTQIWVDSGFKLVGFLINLARGKAKIPTLQDLVTPPAGGASPFGMPPAFGGFGGEPPPASPIGMPTARTVATPSPPPPPPPPRPPPPGAKPPSEGQGKPGRTVAPVLDADVVFLD